jgi:3-hydroxyisobutyrate dehydrogenase-like beta-hydroxyacid dehydrogenase
LIETTKENTRMTTLGFIGTGKMGSPIATNLLAAGHELSVFNRTKEKTRPLAERGALVAPTPALATPPGGVVFTMLSDDAALAEVTLGSEGILSRLGAGGVHVSMSTVAPATARELAARHAEHGSTYVAAPVFGRPDAAAAKKLFVACSGHRTARERVRPLLEAVGQGVFDFGDDPGGANVVKLAGNFLIASAIESMGEAFTFAKKEGVGAKDVADFVAKTLFACPIYAGYGAAIAAERYQPAGFTATLGRKDVGLVLATADETATPMPVASVVHDRLTSAVAKGRGDWDWIAMALGAAEDAGLGKP